MRGDKFVAQKLVWWWRIVEDDDQIDINSIDWYGKLREKEKTKLSVVGIQFSPETTRLPENDGQLSISDRHSPERK